MRMSGRLTAERWLLTVVLGGVALHVALVTISGVNEHVLSAIHCTAVVSAAVLGLLRALRSDADRGAWLCMAVGLLIYGAGLVTYATLHAYTDGPVPTPSAADILWLALFGPTYAGVTMLLRRRLLGLARTSWADALIATLGTAALFAAVIYGPGIGNNTGSLAESAVLVSYVAGGFVLLTLVIGLICVVGWPPGRSLVLLAGGFLGFTVLNSIYLTRVTGDGYFLGSYRDDLYVAAILAIALAAGPSDRLHRARQASAMLLGLSLLFGATSLLVIVQAPHWNIAPIAVALAATTILLTLARVGLLYYDVRTVAAGGGFARTDELTGLPNRRAFGDLLELDMARAGRLEDERFALLLVDLDERFKEVNDSLGHATGDRLLRIVGDRMLTELRRTDTLARWGGDEFAVLLPDADQEQAERVAGRLGAVLREPFTVGDLTLHLGCNIGIALYPDHARDSGELLRQADVAVIEARTSRRNWNLYRPDGDSHTRERLQMVEQLRSALENGGLVLHYQPKASLVTGSIVGVEALVRWQHPVKGLLFPDVILPLVEEAGLMRELTICVLRQALAQCADWRSTGLDLAVAVNFSASSVVDEDLPEMLADLLREYDLPAEFLEVEITEDFLLGDRVRAISVLTRIRELGILVSVDDYGTGYSSLAYLRDLPVDQLKLDRSFVFPMSGDPTAAAIVRSTIGLAHSLGLQMVAEGVEDEGAWRELNLYGCDQAQGYYLSRPVSAEALVQWLATRAEEAAASTGQAERVLELPLQANGEA